MISSSRCNNVVGRTVTMPNECLAVNGDGGYANGCEMTLDDNNEMVMAASVTAGDDQTVAAAIVESTVSLSMYRNKCVEVDCLKQWMEVQLDLIELYNVKLERQSEDLKRVKLEYDKMVENMKETIRRYESEEKQNDALFLKYNETLKHLELLTKQRDDLQSKCNEVFPSLFDKRNKEESLDVMPFTPQSSTCSSGMGDLSSAELPEQNDKPKRRRNYLATVKQPNRDLLEPSQSKRQCKKSNRAKNGDSSKMLDVSLVTTDYSYYTCLGDYDPIKEDLVTDNSNLEIPSWRIKSYSSWYSMEGTENMSDDIYENRHSRLEGDERKRKRWDLQNLRDMQYKEHLLKNGKKKKNPNQDDKEEVTTLLPNPDNIKAIEITEELPISVFGVNLYCKKNSKEFKKRFFSGYYTVGDSPEQSARELRSSGCKKCVSTT